MTRKTKGRPEGAKTDKPASVETSPTKCKKCGSTERTAYHDVRTLAYSGKHPQFGAYDTVVFRRTRCKACDQTRIDKAFEKRKRG